MNSLAERHVLEHYYAISGLATIILWDGIYFLNNDAVTTRRYITTR